MVFPSPLREGWALRSLGRAGVKPNRRRKRLMICTPPVRSRGQPPHQGEGGALGYEINRDTSANSCAGYWTLTVLSLTSEQSAARVRGQKE